MMAAAATSPKDCRADGPAGRRRSPFRRLAGVIAALVWLLAAGGAAAEKVVLQLQWDHQFQFAGFYAAQWQGYYAEAGIEVEIRSGISPASEIVNAPREVAEGRAHFGVTGADILRWRDRGTPLVVLAPIFQHSAVAFYARAESDLSGPADLLRLRVARVLGAIGDVELQAMLRNEGIDPSRLSALPHEPALRHLAEGRVDVSAGYTIATPWEARQLGLELVALRPVTYGVDFYGDTLFTHQRVLDRDRDLVDRFVAASLKGWSYALDHEDEVAARIAREVTRVLPVDDPAGFNRFQAEEVRKLALYPVVALGHVNPERWRRMHEQLREAGVVEGDLDLDALLHDPRRPSRALDDRFRQVLWVTIAVVAVIALGFFAINRVLRRVVAARTRALRDSEQRLAHAQRIARLGNYQFDARTGTVSWSDEMYRIFGRSPADFQPSKDSFIEAVHPDDRTIVRRRMGKLIESDAPGSIEYRIRRPTGEVRIVRDEAEIVRDAAGVPTLWRGAVHDLTDSSLAETLNTRLGRIIERSANEVYVFDSKTLLFIQVNDGARNNLGYSMDELRRMTPLDLKPEHSPESFAALVEPLRDGTQDMQVFETVHRRKDGSLYDVEVRLQLIRSETPPVFAAIIVDTTERKRVERALLQERNFVSAVLDTANALIVVLDRDGRITRFNRTCEAVTGYRADEVLGRRVWDMLLPPEEVETVKAVFGDLYAKAAANSFENHWVARDGTLRLISWTNGVVVVDCGAVEYVTAVGIDVTERRRIEDALRRSEASLANAQRIAHLGNWDWNIVSNELRWSDEIYRIFGLAPQQFGATYDAFLESVHPDDRELVTAAVDRALYQRESYAIDHRIVLPNGEVRTVHEQGEATFDATGTPLRMTGTVLDVTERRQVEERLRLQAQIIDQIHDSVISTDLEGVVTSWNKGAERLFGYAAEEMRGQHISLVYPPEDLEFRQSHIVEPLQREGVHEAEVRLRRKSGEDFLAHMSLSLLHDANGVPYGMIGYSMDITERRRAETALRESEARLNGFFAAAPNGMVIFDDQLRYVLINGSLALTNGLPPDAHLGRTMRDVVPRTADVLEPMLREVLKSGQPMLNVESVAETPAEPGVPRHWLSSNFPILGDDGRAVGVGSVVSDITEQKRAEAEVRRLNQDLERRVEERTAELRAAQDELLKRERLAVLGQLTATVSHELRNPLGTIRTSLAVIDKHARDAGLGVDRALDRVNRNVARCDSIIEEMLDYARSQDLRPAPTVLDEWLEELLDELRVPDGVVVGRELAAGETTVPLDRERFRRAVINVYQNACQAVVERNGVDEARRARAVTVASKATRRRIEVSVSDTGPGMPPDVLERAFEPLFSTKGFGIGLGLPIVKQIVERHGGGVDIASTEGRGTRVVLWLPLEHKKEQDP